MIKTAISILAESYQNNSLSNQLSISLLRVEILAGLTVAIALVPEAVAFAFVAGVEPLVGLYAAFIVGLVTALFGGRPGMISGATGALAVVMISLVSEHGVQYLFATVILMGILQILAGVFKLGKFIRMVPQPVMLGFVNGLAIVIALAQIRQFQYETAEGNLDWMSGMLLSTSVLIVCITMVLIWLSPKITRLLPGPLAAIIIVSLVVIYFDIPVPSVGDLAPVAGGLPLFSIPMVPLNLETIYYLSLCDSAVCYWIN